MSLCISDLWRHSEKADVCKPGREYCNLSINGPWSQTSNFQNCENIHFCFLSHPWYFVMAVELTKILLPHCLSQLHYLNVQICCRQGMETCRVLKVIWKDSGPLKTFFLFLLYFIFPLYSKGIKLSLHVCITLTFFPHPFFCCNMSI